MDEGMKDQEIKNATDTTDSIVDLDSPPTIESDIYGPEESGKKPFELDLTAKLKDIPDYETTGKVKPKKRLSVFAKIMFALVIIGISVFFALSILFVTQDVFGIKKRDYPIVIDIPEEAGVSKIANILEERGVINSALMFKAYYKLTKVQGSLNYGAFNLNSNMSYDLIIEELQKYSATKDDVKVVIPEGFTIYQIALELEKSKVCKATEFVKALQTQDFGFDFEKDLTTNALRYHKLEGFVFPETYQFFQNDNPFNVAKKMLAEFNKRISDDMRAQMKAKGYTVQQALTIASIIQEEAGKTAEMKKVASVYLNRLKNSGEFARLQADPTRDYANEIKKHMDVIDQEVLNAYNTYEGFGLPPGPICNPGLEAIEALLNPAETKYYYFCTNLKTGEFYYAETLKQHNINVRKAGLRQ